MERRTFGWTKQKVPVVGLGTWNMERDDRASCIRALRAGMDLGLLHVDTAELYGAGRVEEEIVKPAIAGRRDDVFLVSKVLPSNATRAGTLAACERSLARLGTDHLDVYLLHWTGPHPLEDTIAAFEELVAAGKIRFWGVSNFDVEDLEQAAKIAGKDRIACNQVLYHLEERAIEHAILPWCAKRRIPVVAYSPFGSGPLPGPKTKGGRALAAVAEAHGVDPHAVALAFLQRDPHVFTIPKSADADHVRANAAAGDLTLTKKELALLDAAFPRGRSKALPSL